MGFFKKAPDQPGPAAVAGPGTPEPREKSSPGKGSWGLGAKGKKTKGKAQPDRAAARREFLALRPMRNPALAWEEENERVVLTVKRGTDWKVKMLNIFFPIPEEKRVVLDPIGSDVWRFCDGETTVEVIARRIAKQYQVGPRQAELSLQQFFKDLGRRGYVGFAKAWNAEKSDQGKTGNAR